MLEENHVATTEEVVDRTLKRLRTLGSQRFASSPYSEHFSRWQTDLAYVLSEFESSPTISTDDQFVKERSQILSNVELKLEERRREETALEEAIKSLSDSKILLERIEEEYATKAREFEGRKNSEIKRLNNKIDALRGELDEVARMKAGLFRAISKKAKAQKETETTQRLNTAQRELALAVQNFTAEQERLPDEYEKKKQPVIEQIRDHQKKIENLETDGSLEDRRVVCEALVNAVNALLQRKTASLQ
jgi:DNA repair exonuclease SbcCD ATPase subunit